MITQKSDEFIDNFEVSLKIIKMNHIIKMLL